LAEHKERSGRQLYEEYAYVLDFMPQGKPGTRAGYRAGPVVQVIGESFYTLLEANARSGVTLRTYDRVYVGKNKRDVITYIIGRVGYDELTTNAKLELPNAIERIVLKQEERFIEFFNTAHAMTPRMHALELIPGIGKKYMWQIVDEREKRRFTNFDDLQSRVNIPNPAKLVAKRIAEELSGESKYRIFIRAS